MNLDQAQRDKVVEWIAQGLKLAEIQNRLISEFGLRVTYMEVRLLVDDLKLTPKDPEVVKPVPPPEPAPAAVPAPANPLSLANPAGGVSLTVDQITRPGSMVSGKVTFSDGTSAQWHLDQSGRLGLVAPKPGYRPPAADVPHFQAALEAELARLGM